MKKIYILGALILGLALNIQAQGYTISNSTGTDSDYDYAASGTDILTPTSTDVLSSWQTLPFSFSFYGIPVTGYKASDNGYITFDNSASTSYSANTSVPNVAGPNNAIYAFWDDVNVITGSGSGDRVTTWTYGTTPTRVHVIQWYSVTPVSGTGFLYAAIRIYECGDFDVINSFGNATGMSATIGCENSTGMLGTQVGGSPSISYPSIGSPPDDDVVYSFIGSDVTYDIAMKSSDLTNMVTLGNNSVSGTLQNLGSSTITSFDLHYTVNGGAAVTDNITGVSIASGGLYNFTHGTAWNVTTGGQTLQLCIYADNINSNVDGRSCNDQVCEDLFSNNGVSGDKKVLLEEFTGAWCGWCPDGAVVQENLLSSYPGDVFGVSVHDGDAMEFNEGIRSGFGVSAYPNGMVDRYVFSGEPDEPHSRGSWATNVVTRLAAYTPVNVTFTANSWNSSTRQISITAEANFVDYAAGDLRFVFYVTEDNVVGSGSGYDQVNYLNTTAGHTYQGAGDPIVGFIHRNVLRAVPSGAMGNAGVIPATVSPASSYSESFTYTLPANYDETKIEIIAAVAINSATVGERYVHNVYGEALNTGPIAVEDPMTGNTIAVYPNPNSGTGMLQLTFTQDTEASIAIFDAFGKKVADIAETTFAAGESRIPMDMSELSNGLYFVKVFTPMGTMAQKIVVAK